ncbi:MAG: tRNA (adenosine(37)-N6)-threonylcarbamoyltransferase complex ATPase subunit type 1 TsaE [Firmicutes bacterium]|nr:tRNA (adenosine(37)-N6)-threonylcarbamoyltransferase complex ATPase subunit type 1 TsaE [Bacillota bacterium]
MFVIKTFSPEETRRIGELTGRLLTPGDVIGLIGYLGAGKTVFTQGIAKGMNIKGNITSPTFTLIHEHMGRIPLYHVDVYRLTTPADIETIGIEDYLYGDGVVVLEWADQVLSILPDERLDITIRHPDGEDDNVREIIIKPYGQKYEHMIKELSSIACRGD